MTEVNYPQLINSIPPQDFLGSGISPQESLFLFISYGFELLLIISVLVFIGVFLFGGFLYLSSIGSPIKRKEAKERILGAIQGSFIVAISFLLLTTINQQIVLFQQESLLDSEIVEGIRPVDWEIKNTYFQIPLGLLIEDAALNENAKKKMYDVLEATYIAEGTSNKIERGSKELLEIIKSCPEGQDCCDVQLASSSPKEKFIKAFEFKGMVEEERRAIEEVSNIIKDQEFLRNFYPEEEVDLEEIAKQLEKEIAKEIEEIEKKEEIIEEFFENIPEEEKLIEEEVQEMYEEMDDSKKDLVSGTGVGLGATISPVGAQLLLKIISESVKEWWEENEVKEKLDDILNPSKNAPPSMSPMDINIDLAFDTPARAEQQRLIQENWDNAGSVERTISRWLHRTANIYFDGLLGDYADFPVIGTPPIQEMMFGKDYDRSPQTITEKGLYYLGVMSPDIALSLILPQMGGLRLLARTRLALKLAGSSSFMGKFAFNTLTLYSGDIAIDTAIATIRQALNHEATPKERAMNFGYEVLFSLLPRFGIEMVGEGLQKIGTRMGLIDDISINKAIAPEPNIKPGEGLPIDKGMALVDDLDMRVPRNRVIAPDPNIKPGEVIQYDLHDWAAGIKRHGENAYTPVIENFIEAERGKSIRLVSLENMTAWDGGEPGQLIDALISRPNNIPIDADVIIYGHGGGPWNTQEWKAKGSGVSVMDVIEQNLKPNQTALVIVCADEGKGVFDLAKGYGFFHNGSEIIPVNGSQLHQIDFNTPLEHMTGRPYIPQESPGKGIEIDIEDLLPQKTDPSSYFSQKKENNLARVKAFFNHLFGINVVFAEHNFSCSWSGDVCREPCVNSSYRECATATVQELLRLFCCCCPEEPKEEPKPEEEEEEEKKCPSCPLINPPIQAKIAEIEGYLAELSTNLDDLLLTKEPLKEDLYQLYKVVMLKSLGKRHVFGYVSLLLEVSKHERGSVIIETDIEETVIGEYFWNWSQWVNNILYEIEVNNMIIEENDAVTFYLKKPDHNNMIEDALSLAREAKRRDIQSIGKIGIEREAKKIPSVNFFANITRLFIEKSKIKNVSAQEINLSECLEQRGVLDISEISPQELESILEDCGITGEGVNDIRLPGEYLSCGTEIPSGEALEITWDHLMEILEKVDEYVEEGRTLIEEQARMNELSRNCECPCQDSFCPVSCGQCNLTCDLGAIEKSHQEVLAIRERMRGIAGEIELLTDGHFNTTTEDVCDLLNEDIRSEEEKVLCYAGGSKFITKHELITRKLNYSRFSFDNCTTRHDHLDDVLDGSRSGKAPLFGPLAEERNLSRYTKTKENNFMINTSDFNWFCCSQ